ncbi:MAG: DUF4124 domain-containing protein [Burkholderiales bacterium]
MWPAAPRLASTLVAALVFPAASALAQVYKCAGANGTPVYQDAPCGPGLELRNFTTDPPPVSVVPMRPAPGSTTRVTTAPPPRERRSAAMERKAKPGSGDPNERRYLRPGMHEGEVMARLGPPDLRSGANRRQVRWTYLPVPGDPQTLTTVVFDAGKVIEVERKVVR